jgi:hypothetical protein
MWSIPGKLVRGLRTHGFNYLAILARNELSYPQLSFTPRLRNAMIAVMDRVRPDRSRPDAIRTDCLQFVCDLAVISVAFDFTHCLAAAELKRRQLGLAGIEVIFVPGPEDGLRQEPSHYDQVMPATTRHWRVRHILLAMLALLPSVRGYTLCASREEAAALISRDAGRLYPEDYRLYLPRQAARRVVHDRAARGVSVFPMLRAPERARELVAQFLDREAHGRRAIVITLRDYPYTPQRNSRIDDWVRFASTLDHTLYAPIFVFDSETIMHRSKADVADNIVCEAASWDLEIRMALYEAAWLNMAVMHGPMELCWFSESARYLIFLEIGLAAVGTEAMLVEAGHPPGRDLIFAKPCQHIVWEGDHLSVLQREFAAMLPRLEEACVTPRQGQLAGAP